MFTAADSTTGLDFYDFREQLPDRSEGRFPDGTNTWTLFTEPTIGGSNQTTAVDDNQTTAPRKFALYQNYPNPFNPRTTISFSLPTRQKVALAIFNALGQKIISLVDDILDAGNHSLQWQAENMPSGVYLYQITSDTHTVTKKMILLR